jgi:hypothetical protein
MSTADIRRFSRLEWPPFSPVPAARAVSGSTVGTECAGYACRHKWLRRYLWIWMPLSMAEDASYGGSLDIGLIDACANG